MADPSRPLSNNRRNEISLLLSRNGGETLLWRHEQLEEAAYALRRNWCQISRLDYDTILTGLNHEITQLTGLTNPETWSSREAFSVTKLTQRCTQSGRRIQNNTMNTKQETEAAAVTATDTQQIITMLRRIGVV